MHILITDSGVGGVSVVAYAERFLSEHGFDEPVQLTFANAAPANDYGYNSMKTREEKLETFERFLSNVSERYTPDLIYVACNTLSVLLPSVAPRELISRGGTEIPIRGIVDTAVNVLIDELQQDRRSVALIFGTQTTIDSGTYPRMLMERGIDASRIVTQACPGLADTISEDREGSKTAAEIREWVGRALEKLERPDVPLIASLNCTHYGYRKEMFRAALNEQAHADVVNPNESAVDDIFPSSTSASRREPEVRFVTRYTIPPATVEALTFFLEEIGPRTVAAMRAHEHVPNLF